jgi:ribose/xylose/arabinose/galactoside ABC-type transport system permease subunit
MICIVVSLLFPEKFRYLSAENLQILLKSIPQLGILAIGVGLLMIAGEFDLSVGSNFVLSAYLMAVAYNSGVPVPLAILTALAVGSLIGFLNGLLVIKTGMPSFIATLGTMMFWRGVVLFLSQGFTKPFHPGGVTEAIFSGTFGPIQAQFVWLFIVCFVCFLLLERHKLGNHIFSVGGNKQSAIAIGVNVKKVKLITFVMVGFLAAFSGVISTMRVHSVSPAQGEGLELQAIAACVIGGLSLMGGEGTILGIFMGTSLLYVIQDVLLLLRAPGFYLQMFMGILIVVAVIFNNLTRKE